VDAFLVGYRLYPGNMSSDRARMASSMIMTISRHIEAHPTLSPHGKRWIRAKAYEFAFSNFRQAGDLRSAGDAFAKMWANDPVLGAAWVGRLTAGALRKGLAACLPGERHSMRPTPFLSLDPAHGVELPTSPFLARRMRQLTDDDRALVRCVDEAV
jgi:hypothetical protein